MHFSLASWDFGRKPGTSRSLWVVGLLLLWAAAYLPSAHVRDLRLEEGRRATPAREMLATGDFIVPRIYGDVYLNKPPVFFWLIAGIGGLRGGVDEVSTRLPSILSVLGLIVVALRFGRGEVPFSTRALSALLLLTTSSMLDKGSLGEIDVFLTLLVGLAWMVWLEDDKDSGPGLKTWAVLGLLLGTMAMTKGPGGPMQFYFALIPALWLQRRAHLLKSPGHGVALLIAALPVLIWLTLVFNRTELSLLEVMTRWREQLGVGGESYDHQSIWSMSRRYIHFPFQAAAMLLPWTVFLPPAFHRDWGQRAGISCRFHTFLLCATLVPMLVFWIWPAGRPRYAMASLLPGCLMAALSIQVLSREATNWLARIAQPRRIVSVAVAIAVGAAMVWLWVMPEVAQRSGVRRARASWKQRLPGHQVVYISRAFLRSTPLAYCLPFYLAENLRGVNDLTELPLDHPITVLLPREQLDAISTHAIYQIEVLDQTEQIPGVLPALLLVRIEPRSSLMISSRE